MPALSPFWKSMLQNKYVATALLALLWSTFIHDLGLPFLIKESRQLNQAKKELSEVESANESLRQEKLDVLNDARALERYARENYFMRKTNEEVYRILD